MRSGNSRVGVEIEEEEPFRSTIKGQLMVLCALMLVIVGSIAGLVIFTATTQPENNSGNAVRAAGESLSDLSYPGATRLTLEDKDIWPEGKPAELKSDLYGILVSADDPNIIKAYYLNRLDTAGYTTPMVESCPDTECEISISASSEQVRVQVVIIPEKVLKGIESTPQKIRAQVKPGQNLISYQISPIVPTPTPVIGTIAPLPTQIPATPIGTGSVAFVGPDNNFYTDDSLGLVSTNLPQTIKSAEGKLSLRLEWLVATREGTRLGVTIEGDPKLTRLGNNIGALVDESGKRYSLSYLKGNTVSDSTTATQSLVWQAPALPVGTKLVSFEAGEGVPVKPNSPVSLPIASFKEAKLPQATTYPAIITDLKGLKIRAPYAYFGTDRTVLLLNTKVTGQSNFQGLGMLKYGTGGVSSLIATDDSGRVLDQPLLPGPTPAGGHAFGPPLNVEANGDVLVVLGPVTPGTKTLTLKYGGYSVSLSLNPSGKLTQPATQGNFSVPLVELLKSGEVHPGPTIELEGVKVQITSMSAKLNEAKQEIDLTVKAVMENQGETLGQLVPGASSSNNLLLSCYQCLRTPQSGFTATAEQQQARTELLPFEFHFIYNYDLSQTEVQLAVANLNYTVTGQWEITLPIPSHP